MCSSLLAAVVTGLSLGLSTDQAWAGSGTSVTNVSVSSTSTAAGALANWTIGFTTSNTGALAYPGSSVTVTLPTGTTFGSYEGGSVTDTTTGDPLVVSGCSNTSGTTVVCTFNEGYSANAGDVLSVVLTDVTNPTATGSATTTVSTSADTKNATAAFTVTAAQAVSSLSVTPSSAVAGALANWTVGFTTSNTGALAYPGSSVTVTLPTGTTFGSFEGGSVTDTTTGDPLSYSCSNTSGTTMTCTLNEGYSVNAGDVLSVVLNDVTNPTTTGSATTTVSTSADTKTATKSVTLTAAQAVSNLSVAPSSTAVGATTDWTVGFTTSSTGALPYPGSTVTVTLPTGTTFGSYEGGSVTDTTTGDPLSYSCSNTSGTTMTCTLNEGYSASAGDVLSVVLNDVTNPTTTGSATTTVSTSADTKTATKSVTLTTAQAVTNVSVTPSSTAVDATTDWTVGFTTSSSGALPYPGSTVTVTLPTGTTFGSYEGGTVTDTTTGDPLSDNCSNTSGTTMTCTFNYGNSANAGDALSVVLTDVTNPTTTGSATTTVSTSADTKTATKSVTLTAAQAVANLSVSPSSTAASATTDWTVGFTTSSSGALPYPGSTVTVTLPTGTTFGSYEGGTVTDTTTGDPLSYNCSNTSGTTMTCTLNEGYSVNAGDVLSVVLNDVTNPTTTGSATTTVSTSADTKTATKSVTLTAAQAVANLSVTPSSTAASATTDWTVGFTTSNTGALEYPGSTVTVTLPTGTTFGSFAGGTVTDTTTGDQLSDNCPNTSGTTVVCTLNYGYSVNAGDALSVVLTDVTNPTATGSATTTVSTSADTKTATKSVTLTAAQAVANLSVTPASTAASATTDWTVGFTTSSAGALPYPGSTVTVTLPTGTTFGSYEEGTVTDTTTGDPLSYDCSNTGGTTMTCTLDEGYSASAGDVLSVVLNDVTNPTTTGSATTTVSTSADTKTATKSVTLTAAQAVSNLSVTPSSTAVGATTDWTVGFTTSNTGALPYPGSTVTVTLPTGTTFGSYEGGMVTDTTTGDPLSDNCSNTSGTTMTCTFNYGNSASAGDVLSVVLNDVTNPTTTGSATTTVSTSADTKTATKSVTLTAAQAVANLSVSPASTVVGATTDWTLGFNTSSSGALPYPGSTVTVTLPTGTTFGSYEGGTVTDTTTGDPLSYDCSNTSGTTMTCTLDEGYSANAGDVLAVVLNDVTNPTTAGSATTTVFTSADTDTATQSVTLTGAQTVANLSVSPTSTAVGALAAWTVGFTTSSSGALPYPGSTVTVTLPTGTTFGSYEGGSVTDTTNGDPLSDDCTNTSWNDDRRAPSTTATRPTPGDVLSVVLNDVTNPTTTGSATTTVSTSADTDTATQSVTLTAAQAVANLSVSPASTSAGAKTDWTVGFTTSSSGALPYPGSTVTVALPTGTTFGSYEGGSVTDTTNGDPLSDDCPNTTGTTVVCTLNYGYSANAGDALSIVLDDVSNPTTTGSATTTVFTSADTNTATKSITVTAAQGPVCSKLSGTISGNLSIKKCTPTSTTYVKAKGLASALTSSGTFKWSTSGKTTEVQDTLSSPGQGSCVSGSVERDVFGYVVGGTSKYTKSGDLVFVKMCQSATGALTLVPGTKAIF